MPVRALAATWPLEPALARPAFGVVSILVFVVPGICCPRAVTAAARRGAAPCHT